MDSNGRLCLECGLFIPIVDTPKGRYEAKRKKFCNHSCAASYTNRQNPKRKSNKSGLCKKCGALILFPIRPDGTPRRIVYCNECKLITKKGRNILGTEIANLTLAELIEKLPGHHNWRSRVQQHAKEVFHAAKPEINTCELCRYSNAIQVCHIKGVAKFDKSTMIKVVNQLDNLVALCPNHHWELDHGFVCIIKR